MAKTELASVFTDEFIFTLYVERIPEIWTPKLLKKFFKSSGHNVPDFLKVEIDTETLKEISKEVAGDGQSRGPDETPNP